MVRMYSVTRGELRPFVGRHGCMALLAWLSGHADYNGRPRHGGYESLPFWYTDDKLGCGEYFIKCETQEIQND